MNRTKLPRVLAIVFGIAVMFALSVSAVAADGTVLPADGHSLQTKLAAALDALARGNRHAAIGSLTAFGNQVRALVRTGALTSAQGQPLIDTADALIGTLGT